MARRKYEPTGVRWVDAEFGYVGRMLDEAEDAKTPGIFQTRCKNALTAFYGIGVEVQDAQSRLSEAEHSELDTQADYVLRDYAKRFMRVCVKASRALDGADERRRRSMGAYEDALPAGGEVFEAEGTESPKKGRRGRGNPTHKGVGSYCVYSAQDKLVRCFEKMETAQEVARGFGSGFHAKARE